jgi:hypothetical protein
MAVIGDYPSESASAGLSEYYRSPGLPAGYFRQIGNLHLHVDGPGNRRLVTKIMKELEGRGSLGKLTSVMHALAGPQRKQFPETYRSHTPGSDGHEEFGYFSTIALSGRDHAIAALRLALRDLASQPGIVLEAEQVVGMIDVNDRWSCLPGDNVLPIESAEVGFEAGSTKPFEVHHCLNIRESRPLQLEQVLKDTSALGIAIGGWFEFRKEGAWAYRSNAFFEADGLEKRVRAENVLISRYLREHGLRYELWTLVEASIGVWQTPIHAISGS